MNKKKIKHKGKQMKYSLKKNFASEKNKKMKRKQNLEKNLTLL